MIKKLLLMVCCTVFISDCIPKRKRKLIFPPRDKQPETLDPNAVRTVALGDSFSIAPLLEDPTARFEWEVVWDKQMLEGSQSREEMCLSDDNCLKVIKYEFKAMQRGEALIELRLKENDKVIESLTRRIIVAEDGDDTQD